MKERIQERLEKEFKTYKEHVLSLSSEEIFSKSYETAVKQEIASYFAEWTSDEGLLEFLDKFTGTEALLDYLYESWLDADGGIDNEIFNTLEIVWGVKH